MSCQVTPVSKVRDVSSGPGGEDLESHGLDWSPGVPDGALEHGVEGEDHQDVPSPAVDHGPTPLTLRSHLDGCHVKKSTFHSTFQTTKCAVIIIILLVLHSVVVSTPRAVRGRVYSLDCQKLLFQKTEL